VIKPQNGSALFGFLIAGGVTMRRQYRFGAALAVGALLVLAPMLARPSSAQAARGAAAAKDDNRPIPRLPDGHVSFEAPPGEKGVWNRQDYRPLLPTTLAETALRDRNGNNNDGPPGLKPKGSETFPAVGKVSLCIVRRTKSSLTGGASLRWIPQHGDTIRDRIRPGAGTKRMTSSRPADPTASVPSTWTARCIRGFDPSYYGHSVGRWEGDTLVVDTVGFNERGWIDAYGTPTTKQLHLVEKWTRLDFKTLRYEITIDDPGAYTAPWTTGMLMSYASGREMFEFVCQDGNLAGELMIGGDGVNKKIDRTSPVAP
jgi:hypothetical protein